MHYGVVPNVFQLVWPHSPTQDGHIHLGPRLHHATDGNWWQAMSPMWMQ